MTRETLDAEHDVAFHFSAVSYALDAGGGRVPRLRASTFEREQDTWDSLISTPLSGWQILRGKSRWGDLGFAWFRRALELVLDRGACRGCDSPVRALGCSRLSSPFSPGSSSPWGRTLH